MILDEIVANKRLEVGERKARVSLAECRRQAESAPNARDFVGALDKEQVALIAEIKLASPSRGDIRSAVDPAGLAKLYAENGAAAISVLTDEKYFRGELESLVAARRACSVPVLRKDFLIDEYQVYESRAHSADAILLIGAILNDSQLLDFGSLAELLGMSALVEVHNEAELERALFAGAGIIGINNRNLFDFSVDISATERLTPLVPPGIIVVSESGICSRADVERAALAGAHAALVGEALMRASNVGAMVRELSTVPRAQEQMVR